MRNGALPFALAQIDAPVAGGRGAIAERKRNRNDDDDRNSNSSGTIADVAERCDDDAHLAVVCVRQRTTTTNRDPATSAAVPKNEEFAVHISTQRNEDIAVRVERSGEEEGSIALPMHKLLCRYEWNGHITRRASLLVALVNYNFPAVKSMVFCLLFNRQTHNNFD